MTDRSTPEPKFDASYYRTQWLMAHNRLHEIADDENLAQSEKISDHWRGYLADLDRAGEVASQRA
jgi:hypothetical protein